MGPEVNPWHSNPTQNSFRVYIQTAGMEMAHANMTLSSKTIAGSTVIPYVVEGLAALDINDRWDWVRAEEAVKRGVAPIPESLR